MIVIFLYKPIILQQIWETDRVIATHIQYYTMEWLTH